MMVQIQRLLAAKLDQRVKLSVITHKISVSDNVWIVSFRVLQVILLMIN